MLLYKFNKLTIWESTRPLQFLAGCITVFCLTVGPCFAASKDIESAHTFLKGELKGLKYRLHVPAKQEPGVKQPLVVFLHGVGERGSDNEAQTSYSFFKAKTGVIAQSLSAGAFVLAPQAPLTDKWIKIKKWKDPSYRFSVQPEPSMAAVAALIKKIATDYSIDPRRIYLTGLSMGAFGVFDLLTREPGLFAAALAVCGRGDPAVAKVFAGVPLYMVHGDKDNVVPVSYSRAMASALKKLGATPILKELEGVGHNSWDSAFTDPQIASWLFSQKRQLGKD